MDHNDWPLSHDSIYFDMNTSQIKQLAKCRHAMLRNYLAELVRVLFGSTGSSCKVLAERESFSREGTRSASATRSPCLPTTVRRIWSTSW